MRNHQKIPEAPNDLEDGELLDFRSRKLKPITLFVFTRAFIETSFFKPV